MLTQACLEEIRISKSVLKLDGHALDSAWPFFLIQAIVAKNLNQITVVRLRVI
jgi:hypothetical protein